jgi:mono/diheme cytochrome c family protein
VQRQAGGRVFGNTGLRAVTPNITPDLETGIGGWTEAQFADAMRNGRRPDGTLIGPPMPVDAYRGISDRDLSAIWAYLRGVPPVRNSVTGRSVFPREPTRFAPVASVPEPPMQDPVRRGEYLAVALLHCMDCHSPRIAMDRADPARIGAGGRVFQTPSGPLPARNITSHPEAGIGDWSDGEIWRAIAEAKGRDGRRLYLTMASRAEHWSRLTTRDRADLIAYLRALPPLE